MKNNEMPKDNRLSGRYEIIEQIGIGGMSYVYKAFDIKQKKIVAIKVLKDELAFDDEFVEKFKSEALASINIKHKNVISAFDVVDEDNVHYIAMDYAEGETLTKYIKKHGPLSNEEAVKVTIQVAKGLRAAHEKGIIHRDIKPQNIVVSDNFEARITDFGIARAITSTTKNISVVGTVHYISPEQVRNSQVDFRSDIYSLGCTMYEMVTGKVPFSGDVPLEIVISHLRENITPPSLINPNIYKSIEKIILKASRMIPRERYQTMDEMIDDLNRAIAEPDGNYIVEASDEDVEGKTVIITDDDMKVIKAVSEKFTNKNSYKEQNAELTPDQKRFFETYIRNGAYKQHVLMKRIIIGVIVAALVLVATTIFISIDTRKKNIVQETKVTGVESLITSLEGIELELAQKFTSDYGVNLFVESKEFNDNVSRDKIIKVLDNEIDDDKIIRVVVSKGPFVIDFSDVQKLQQMRLSDMIPLLDERELKYKVVEINDINVPRGFIIGANKQNSAEDGELIITISRGISDSVKTMPDLYKKPVSEAYELLTANELLVGNVSFIRDYNIPENHVIRQSCKEGDEINSGTKVDLVVSCGRDGVELIAESKKKWYSEISATYKVIRDNENVTQNSNSIIIQIRLMQITPSGVIYTELKQPEEYKIGTVIPIVFSDIEGEENVRDGEVQVVDVERDKILSSIKITFWERND